MVLCETMALLDQLLMTGLSRSVKVLTINLTTEQLKENQIQESPSMRQ